MSNDDWAAGPSGGKAGPTLGQFQWLIIAGVLAAAVLGAAFILKSGGSPEPAAPLAAPAAPAASTSPAVAVPAICLDKEQAMELATQAQLSLEAGNPGGAADAYRQLSDMWSSVDAEEAGLLLRASAYFRLADSTQDAGVLSAVASQLDTADGYVQQATSRGYELLDSVQAC